MLSPTKITQNSEIDIPNRLDNKSFKPLNKKGSKLLKKWVVFPAERLGHGTYGDVCLAMKEDDYSEYLEYIEQVSEEHSKNEVSSIASTYCPKLYACKQIQRNDMNEDQLNQINREATTNRAVSECTNVVSLQAVLQSKNNFYFIMDLCNGGNLRDLTRAKGRQLTETEVQRIMCQVANGLEEINSEGVIHRDIKRENIMLNFPDYSYHLDRASKKERKFFLENVDLLQVKNLEFKIADFGLARIVQSPEEQIQTNGRIGTPLFMSPQIQFYEAYTSKTDVWSLGELAKYLLTGSQSFPGTTIDQIANMIEQGQVLYPCKSKTSIECLLFVTQCLTYQEKDRLAVIDLLDHPFLRNYDQVTPIRRNKSSDFGNSSQQSEISQYHLITKHLKLKNELNIIEDQVVQDIPSTQDSKVKEKTSFYVQFNIYDNETKRPLQNFLENSKNRDNSSDPSESTTATSKCIDEQNIFGETSEIPDLSKLTDLKITSKDRMRLKFKSERALFDNFSAQKQTGLNSNSGDDKLQKNGSLENQQVQNL